MKIWILMEGEDHEGGRVDSVYAERDLAAGRFMEMAQKLAHRFGTGLDEPVSEDDGSLYIHSGCDWVSLAPHDVVGQPSDRIPRRTGRPAAARARRGGDVQPRVPRGACRAAALTPMPRETAGAPARATNRPSVPGNKDRP